VKSCEFASAGDQENADWDDPHVVYRRDAKDNSRKKNKAHNLTASGISMDRPWMDLLADAIKSESLPIQPGDHSLLIVGLATDKAKNIDLYEREITLAESLEPGIELADLLRGFRKKVYGLRGRVTRSKSLAASMVTSICPDAEAHRGADVQRLLCGCPEAWRDAQEAYGPAILALIDALQPDHTVASERRRRHLANIRPRMDTFAEEEGGDT